MGYQIRRGEDRGYFDHGWLQVMEGELKHEKEILKAGDGVSFERTPSITIEATKPSKVLFFDLN